jgi:hypothetical protein
LFRRKRKLRRVINDDNDSDEEEDEHGYIKFKFDLEGSENPKSSLPKETMIFELAGTSESEGVFENNVVTGNSGVPQIFMQKIGGKKHITPLENNVVNNVILEVEGSATPPTFVPYNYVHHRIKMHKTENNVLNNDVCDNDVSDNDVQRSHTPEHVPWGSQSPETPWSQKKEQLHFFPQNSEDTLTVPLYKLVGIQLLGLYHPSGKNLFFLFIIYYIFIFSYIHR